MKKSDKILLFAFFLCFFVIFGIKIVYGNNCLNLNKEDTPGKIKYHFCDDKESESTILGPDFKPIINETFDFVNVEFITSKVGNVKDNSDSLFFIVSKDGKRGVLNAQAKYIVPAEYSRIVSSRDVFFAYPVSDTTLIYSLDGKLLYKTKGTFEKINNFNAHVLFDNKTKTIVILEDNFKKIAEHKNFNGTVSAVYPNGRLLVRQPNTNYYKITKLDGTELIPPVYTGLIQNVPGLENTYTACINNKCGVIDENNKIIVPIEYKAFRFYGYDTYCGMKDNEKVCFDKNGKVINDARKHNENRLKPFKEVPVQGAKSGGKKFVPRKYKNKTLYYVSKYDYHWDFKRSSFIMGGNKYTLLDKNSRKLHTFYADSEPKVLSENLFVYKNNGKIHFTDKYGRRVFKNDYDNFIMPNADDVQNDYLPVCKNSKWGIITFDEKVLVPFDYDQLLFMNNHFRDKFFALKNGKWGIVDINNNVVLNFNYCSKPVLCRKFIVVQTPRKNVGRNTLKNTSAEKTKTVDNANLNRDNAILKRDIANELCQQGLPPITEPAFSPKGELHVVGVYEGALLNQTNTLARKGLGLVEVNVEKTGSPISLLLSSSDNVEWIIHIAKGVQLKDIYFLSPGQKSRVIADSKIPVTQLPQHLSLNKYDFAVAKLLSGKKPSSYQYEYKSRKFVVDGQKGSEMAYPAFPSPLRNVKMLSEPWSKRMFPNKLTLMHNGANAGPSSVFWANKYYKKGDGKYYFEVRSFGNSNTLKMVSPSESEYIGDSALFRNYDLLSGSWGFGVVGVAVDFDNGKVYISQNGKWNGKDGQTFCLSYINNKNGFFEENAKPTRSFFNDGNQYTVFAEVDDGLNVVNINFGANKFKYEMPEGYKPYDTYSAIKKHINQNTEVK